VTVLVRLELQLGPSLGSTVRLFEGSKTLISIRA